MKEGERAVQEGLQAFLTGGVGAGEVVDDLHPDALVYRRVYLHALGVADHKQ
jgi:hypothetical protein